MAGTSLARQLASLRTPGSASRPTTATYSGPFLFPEAEALTSLAALKEAAAESLGLLCQEEPLLARFSLLLEAAAGEEEELVKDCLYSLCPVGLGSC